MGRNPMFVTDEEQIFGGPWDSIIEDLGARRQLPHWSELEPGKNIPPIREDPLDIGQGREYECDYCAIVEHCKQLGPECVTRLEAVDIRDTGGASDPCDWCWEPGISWWKEYRIKGNSRYFAKKYGTPNPTFVLEGTDRVVFGDSWMNMVGNKACMLYAIRSSQLQLPMNGTVYYGKIGMLGELVHESELEEIV